MNFLDKLRDQGIDEDALSTLVQEESELVAAEINSSGLLGQVRFLVKRGYTFKELLSMFG